VAKPAHGEVWLVELDPIRGHEQGGTRPALVLSVEAFNALPLGMVLAAPLTTKSKGFPFHVALSPPEGGIKAPSWIRCEDLRGLSTDRFRERWGVVRPDTLHACTRVLQHLLGL
jgi:mRNA interferase MazF